MILGFLRAARELLLLPGGSPCPQFLTERWLQTGWIPSRCKFAHTSVLKGIVSQCFAHLCPQGTPQLSAPQLDPGSLFPAYRAETVSPASGPCCPPHFIWLWEIMSQALLNQNKQHTLLLLHSPNQSCIHAELSGDTVQMYLVYSWLFLVFHILGVILWRIRHVTFPGSEGD